MRFFLVCPAQKSKNYPVRLLRWFDFNAKADLLVGSSKARLVLDPPFYFLVNLFIFPE